MLRVASAFSRASSLCVGLHLRGSVVNNSNARTLYALLWVLLPVFLVHAYLGMHLTPNRNPHILWVVFVNGLLLLTPITSLILIRNNFVVPAGVTYLTGVWLVYTLIILFNGGIHHVGLAVYIALPVSAAWLFGYRPALWTAATCVGSATVMALLESIGIGPLHHFQGRPIGVWFILVECTVMGVVPVSVVLASLRKALAQSQLAQSELRRTQEENLNRQKLESLGVLASGIAHDFNNLLGGILATSEFLIYDLGEVSPAREGLETIRSVAVRGSEIVRQLMTYAGQESSAFQEVDLGALVREMLQLLSVSITKTAVLNVAIPATTPSIWANSAQMRQVVMNLITNASDALKDRKGSISVTLKQVSSAENAAGGCEANPIDQRWLRLEVSDTGCGMTEEVRSRIFDPFFSTKSVGRGLGLAAVQGIITSHGGTIKVASRPGEGSTFQVLLPCMSEKQRESAGILPSFCPSANAIRVETVLVIDDEESLRVSTAKSLRATGVRVMEASDGPTGIRLFREHAHTIQAILLDVSLPGTSGPEALIELRNIRSNVPVILTTAYGRESIWAEVAAQNAVFYLQKPYGFGRLISMLLDVCQSDPMARQASAG